jgi:signal transduction histidine kinase
MHRLLEKQIKRYLGEAQTLSPALAAFARAVSEAYASADADRAMIERSLELMSQELTERNADLRTQLIERQRAEAQLEGLLSLIGTTLESTTDGIMALDKGGRLARFNQRFVEMWRIPDDITAFWEHGRMIGCICAQLKHPEDFLAKVDYLCLHSGEENFDLMECLDGRLIERYSLPQPLGVDNVGRVFSFRDITERKLAEAALRREKEEQQALIKKLEAAHNQVLQSEKMASIGQLAAGVAHEINNPIGYVYSNLGMLEKYVQDAFGMIEQYERAEGAIGDEAVLAQLKAARDKLDIAFLKEDLRALMGESKDGIARVKQIVQDLKDFSHVDQAEWQFVDLHRGIDSTLNIARNEIKYNSDIIREYGAIPQVECMASQLNQVFMNMLVNASHAIGDDGHGKITIRTGAENGMVWIEFSDTGKGIAPENLKRIFDPFFTTKPVGKGTGLGLSLSFGIVEKHRGRIEVVSEPGNGATFRIWLPVKRAAKEPA